MSESLVDVTIHVDEGINEDQQNTIIEVLRDCNGVVAIGHQHKSFHLFIVEYDPELVNSKELLDVVKEQGVHAELVGL